MPHPIDLHLGKCIRYRRWKLGMTQSELAFHIGVKFQQIQKYESGANRISASRLWDASVALKVPISFFFQTHDRERKSGKRKIVSPLIPDNKLASDACKA